MASHRPTQRPPARESDAQVLELPDRIARHQRPRDVLTRVRREIEELRSKLVEADVRKRTVERLMLVALELPARGSAEHRRLLSGAAEVAADFAVMIFFGRQPSVERALRGPFQHDDEYIGTCVDNALRILKLDVRGLRRFLATGRPGRPRLADPGEIRRVYGGYHAGLREFLDDLRVGFPRKDLSKRAAAVLKHPALLYAGAEAFGLTEKEFRKLVREHGSFLLKSADALAVRMTRYALGSKRPLSESTVRRALSPAKN